MYIIKIIQEKSSEIWYLKENIFDNNYMLLTLDINEAIKLNNEEAELQKHYIENIKKSKIISVEIINI